MRFAYCKSGDVVAELEHLGPQPEVVPEVGPRHYIGSFLSFVKGQPTLLLSVSLRDAELNLGAVEARSVRYESTPTRPLQSIWMQLRAFWRISIELKRFRPTRIFCATGGGPPLWACYLHSRFLKVPLVCTRHASMGPSTRNPLRKLRRALNEHVLRRSAAVLCHGPYLASELRGVGIPEERLFEFNVAYGELLRDDCNNNTTNPGSPEGAISVLFVGRMIRGKGIFDLYHAALPLLEQHPQLYIVYAGDGRDLITFKDLVHHDGHEQRVIVRGPVDHSNLLHLYRMAHIAVTPTRSSFTESRCKVAIEALVSGRPVIAPNFGPFPYVIEDGNNGMLYTPDDVGQLREKISILLTDHELLAKVTRGAEASGRKYLAAHVGFRDALNQAFATVSQSGLQTKCSSDKPVAKSR